MSSGAEVDELGLATIAASGESLQEPQSNPFGFWPRLAFAVVLLGIGYGPAFAGAVSSAMSGARSAIVVVSPILMVLAATGYRDAPRGVSDHESDWIFAAISGLIGFGAAALLYHRYATLSGLWRLDMVVAILWIGCAMIILFGIRHAIRMWPVWLFAALCVSPWPFLLLTATFGGSDRALAVSGAIFGTAATCLASMRIRRRIQYAAVALFGLGNMAVAAIIISHTTVLVTVLVVAGILPTVMAVALHLSLARGRRDTVTTLRYQRPSWRSLAVLPLIAVAMFLVHPYRTAPQTPPSAFPDWTARSGLSHYASFAFIARFLGPEARFERYEVPARRHFPAAGVDVITTNTLAALHDYADAVWYPTRRPVNYHAAGPDVAPTRIGARFAQTNAYEATTDASRDWYAVTWVWRTPTAYQQVFVVVDQADGAEGPPAPEPLSTTGTSVLPALW
ncbi:MAG: hypothetical protein ACTS5I_15275, partial [Rhodanobacter sp.]